VALVAKGSDNLMRGLAFVIGIISSLMSSVAFSEDASFGSSIVKVSPPKGYCELDKTNKADVALFESASNYAKVGGFSAIALYPDCHEFEEWRKSKAFILTKVLFARYVKHIDRPAPQFITEACEHLRKGLSDELKARISEAVTEFSKGNSSLTNTMSLGVLDEVKGTVCYSGQLGRGKIAYVGDVTFVYLSAGTFVGDEAISISQWTNYVDESSIPKALENLKAIYSHFAAANSKTD
jgi:hypothetical protein